MNLLEDILGITLVVHHNAPSRGGDDQGDEGKGLGYLPIQVTNQILLVQSSNTMMTRPCLRLFMKTSCLISSHLISSHLINDILIHAEDSISGSAVEMLLTDVLPPPCSQSERQGGNGERPRSQARR